MRLIFEDLAKRCFTPERVQKLKEWVENANKARTQGQFERRANQYDKAEELITFYTFAPLCLREDKAETVQGILKLANVKAEADEIASLSFERQLSPPEGYMKWLANHVNEHPVKYVREEAGGHVKSRRTLEANTHVDFTIESKNLLILIELKFTSDISTQTTFNASRNQLARLIDVGLSEIMEGIRRNRRLVILLCSPSEFYIKKSRLYFYKIKEYSDPQEIKRDIEWRGFDEIEKCVAGVSWVPLERVIEITYDGFSHHDKDEALAFFQEKKLVKRGILF